MPGSEARRASAAAHPRPKISQNEQETTAPAACDSAIVGKPVRSSGSARQIDHDPRQMNA